MSSTTCLTNNFRKGLLVGNYDLDSDVIGMALYNAETHGYNTTAYTTVNEVPSSGGYTAKGVTMTGVAQQTDTTNNVSHFDWSDASWATSTITATGCLLFDDTVTVPATDASIYVGDFGGSKSSSSGTFTVVLPAAGYNTSLVRLA